MTEKVLVSKENLVAMADEVWEATGSTEAMSFSKMISEYKNIGGVKSWNDLQDKPFGEIEIDEWMLAAEDFDYTLLKYCVLEDGLKVIMDGTEYIVPLIKYKIDD